MKAYYFAPNNNKLRYGDGRDIVIGKSHTVSCIPKVCKQGLHGSIKALDALQYAPGNMLYIVDITGKVDVGPDKICGQRRKYLAGFDATELLKEFARKQAIINIELIRPYINLTDYETVVEFLRTGDENLRSSAANAAYNAAVAAKYAVKYAAYNAAKTVTNSDNAAVAAANAATNAANAANIMLEQMIKERVH